MISLPSPALGSVGENQAGNSFVLLSWHSSLSRRKCTLTCLHLCADHLLNWNVPTAREKMPLCPVGSLPSRSGLKSKDLVLLLVSRFLHFPLSPREKKLS